MHTDHEYWYKNDAPANSKQPGENADK